MKAIKLLAAVSVLAFSATGVSAYTEVNCSTDAVFSANSCNQCFNGGSKGEGVNLGFLKDEWVNTSDVDKILYDEEQENPKMINLNEGLVTWKQDPGKTGFWKKTQAFTKLYNTEEEGYILKKKGKVTWIESAKGYSYALTKNKAPKGKNIGLLVYPISTHSISANGSIGIDSTEHKECVLFKSGTPQTQKHVTGTKKTTVKGTTKRGTTGKPWVKGTTTKLPQTGPEHYILLLLLAMVLGFGIVKLRKNA